MRLLLALIIGLFSLLSHAQPFSAGPPITSPADFNACTGSDLILTREVSMYVNPRMFPNASPETPNYVMVEVEPNFNLSDFTETVVDLGDEPIYLSVFLLDHDEPGLELNVPPDAVSIIRWRKGEKFIWLRITNPSCNWVTRNGEPVDCARDEARIAWTFGIGVKETETRHRPLYEAGKANRPVNSRADGVPVNTELVLDFSRNEDPPIPRSHSADLFARDHHTQGVETEPDADKIVVGGSSNPEVGVFDNSTTLIWAKNCTEHQYPWVSYNDQFTSTIVANNPSADSATVNFIATRNDGSDYYATRELPPHGFLAENPAALFPEMSKGAGFSLMMRAEPDAAGRWVTYNTSTASNRSPSQGTATRLDDPNGAADTLLFGYLPLGEGFNSAPVIVNAGPLPVDVILYFYDQAGNLILQDSELIKGLGGYRPFAVPTADLLPGHTGDVQMIAHSPEGKITGAVFTFNDNLEPAIGNAQAIPFEPPN